VSPGLRVGFIGLGIMGQPMAGRLLAAGYQLVVHTRTAATAKNLVDSGATWAESATEVAESSDLVITMLPDSEAVRTVYLGADGLIDGLRSDMVSIDMSSIDPSTTREIAERLARLGVVLLDAPVSGGQKGAIDGSLTIMVGGPTEVVERVRPLLSNLGRSITRVGDVGAGQVTKACNQLVVGATIEAVAEALFLARRAGVDPVSVREALLGGFASSRVLDAHGQRMIAGAFEPGFRVRLHRKDAGIVQRLAGSVGSPTPMFDIVAQRLARLDDLGGGDLDHSALFQLLSDESPSPSPGL
jgi:2-hydroxy-3-oxopropionate reductase